MCTNLYEVAVIAPIKQSLTYGQPNDYEGTIPGGTRVLVPLGNRYITGYILSCIDSTVANIPYTVKPICEVLDYSPVFPLKLIPLYRWLSDYYHCPIGEVIKTALPAGFDTGSGKKIYLTSAGKSELIPRYKENVKQEIPQWLQNLVDRGELPDGTSGQLWRKPKEQKLLRKWDQNGWISIHSEVFKKNITNKTETLISLESTFTLALSQEGFATSVERLAAVTKKIPSLKKTEKKTLEIFLELAAQKNTRTIPRSDILRLYTGASKAIKALEKEGVFRLEDRRVFRDPFGLPPPFFPRPKTLTEEQTEVLAQIIPAVEKKMFKPFLLHGVTGCGKTEIYLQSAEIALKNNQTVLVMVPEIALSSQLEAHFFSRFGDLLAVLHSGLSHAQRFDQWERIRKGQAKVVIGARSAIFAPLDNPGLIIVDEEHEPAYKQDDGLRYNGRDVAVLRAHFAQCPVILGSATPSVISFYHAQNGKYTLLNMRKRVNDVALPAVEIIDIGKEIKLRPDLCFSNTLVQAMRENLRANHQTLLFVNRRGYAGFMLCRDCGHIIQCRHCQVSLTLHKKQNRLICHYCGYSIKSNTICPACLSGNITGLGIGSERIEDEVRLLFPEARIDRLDSDTATSKKKYLSILQAVRNREVDILIGTQMIAKGLHFPHMTLVGIVWADSSLGIPDFKSSERTYQLISQVTGRAGRSEYPGKVIIQTHQPQHYTIICAQQHDYTKLYTREVSLRRELGYPPYSRMVNIRLSGANEKDVMNASDKVTAFLKKSASTMTDLDILGPAPAPLAKIKNKTRWQILMKSPKPSQLHHLCDQLSQQLKILCSTKVQLVLDIDPENMM